MFFTGASIEQYVYEIKYTLCFIILIVDWSSRLAVSGFEFAKKIYLAYFSDKSRPPPVQKKQTGKHLR